VSNLLLDPPSKPDNYSTSRRFDKFQVQPQQKKKTKPSHPATLESMSISQLKEVLKNLSLPVNGTKQILIDRISTNRPIPPSSNYSQSNLPSNTSKSTSSKSKTNDTSKSPQNTVPQSKASKSTSPKSTSPKSKTNDTSKSPQNTGSKRKRNVEGVKFQSNKKARNEINLLNADTSRFLSQSKITERREVKPNSKYL
jgi:hypothetical protein